MANQLVVYCATPAPQTIAYSFAASGTGANWDPTKYYAVTVTASYDPDDENIWLTGVLNYGYAFDMASISPLEVLQAGVSPANANDSLVVTWTAPPGPPPHHYNVFIQGPNATDIEYTIARYGDPMSDWAGSSEVTNDTLTFTILDPTDTQGSLVTSVMLTVDTSNKIIEIAGNHLMQFGASVGGTYTGTPVTVDAAGANVSTNVDHTRLIYDARGTITEITVADAIAGCVAGELLTYRDMRHTFLHTDNSYFWSYRGALSGAYGISLTPVLQLSPSMRNRMIRDYQGYLVNRARVLNAPVEYLDVSVCGISCTYEKWQLLMEWLQAGSRLWLIDQNTSLTDSSHYPFPQYLCRLIDTDYVGSIGKNARNRYTLRFEIEEQKAMIGVS